MDNLNINMQVNVERELSCDDQVIQSGHSLAACAAPGLHVAELHEQLGRQASPATLGLTEVGLGLMCLKQRSRLQE